MQRREVPLYTPPPGYGRVEVVETETSHQAIEQQVFPDSQQIKQDIVLGTQSERVTDLVHVGPDVLSVHTGRPRSGFK